ncbi:MAG: hypothetical protein AAGU24_01265 [Dehalogenimonas sp.]
MLDPDKAELLHQLTNIDHISFKVGERFFKELDEHIYWLTEVKEGRTTTPSDSIPDTDWGNPEEVKKLSLMLDVIPSLVARIIRDNNLLLLRLVAPQFLNDDKTSPESSN